MAPFRVVIAGSRQFSDFGLLCERLDALLANKLAQGFEVVVLSGACRGADALGERYAQERGFAVERFPAEWAAFGRSAGPVRNRSMAQACDAAVVFWDGVSRGTANMVSEAQAAGKPVRVVRV
ncbi:DUF2493 domain-containing protein [Synechococcus sp. PCC 6312]|uniref:DUF2493 domain-containing protein n=1 Tax=Synechococcus sp. (strain ATCC 27167 / PCC 6312) TaxID=195253 RepID=UPI00029ECB15|nr:DUF2493 domain-containing protein [Synechococcus sp. PCC 6312]AFY61956.1 Protein of unknown function (DUF2493) [Synechococcus sp. PCC 6312]